MNKDIIEQVLHEIDEYFDNSSDTLRDANNLIQYVYEKLSSEVKDNSWQPDWSVAPDMASAWCKTEDGSYVWLYEVNYIGREGLLFLEYAPSFNYQGDWKDSLYKRP